MKNIFALTLIITFSGCKSFGKKIAITTRTPQGVSQPSGCTSDGNCVAHLAWDSNPGAEQIDRYFIEYGELSRTDTHFSGYPQSIIITNQNEATLVDLEKKDYFISIRSMNTLGQLSPYASEISLTPASMKDN